MTRVYVPQQNLQILNQKQVGGALYLVTVARIMIRKATHELRKSTTPYLLLSMVTVASLLGVFF